MLQWAWAYVTRQRTSRLITEELRVVPRVTTATGVPPEGTRREVPVPQAR